MQQVSSIYLALIFIIAIIATNAAATRGCSAFGHSCFGGHGKRSEIPDGLSIEKMESPTNKDLQYPNINLKSINDNGNDADLIILRSDADYRNPVYSLLKKWIENARNNREEMENVNRNHLFRNNK